MAPPGRRAAGLPAEAFDLVLAVDVFPYLVQAGVAARHVADAARLLRPGGHLGILNLSYRGLEADRAQAALWAADQGLVLCLAGATPFALWDGAAFLLARPSTAMPTTADSSEPANTAAFSSS
jgi:SAM-dependent methyltransferase